MCGFFFVALCALSYTSSAVRGTSSLAVHVAQHTQQLSRPAQPQEADNGRRLNACKQVSASLSDFLFAPCRSPHPHTQRRAPVKGLALAVGNWAHPAGAVRQRVCLVDLREGQNAARAARAGANRALFTALVGLGKGETAGVGVSCGERACGALQPSLRGSSSKGTGANEPRQPPRRASLLLGPLSSVVLSTATHSCFLRHGNRPLWTLRRRRGERARGEEEEAQVAHREPHDALVRLTEHTTAH